MIGKVRQGKTADDSRHSKYVMMEKSPIMHVVVHCQQERKIIVIIRRQKKVAKSDV